MPLDSSQGGPHGIKASRSYKMACSLARGNGNHDCQELRLSKLSLILSLT